MCYSVTRFSVKIVMNAMSKNHSILSGQASFATQREESLRERKGRLSVLAISADLGGRGVRGGDNTNTSKIVWSSFSLLFLLYDRDLWASGATGERVYHQLNTPELQFIILNQSIYASIYNTEPDHRNHFSC